MITIVFKVLRFGPGRSFKSYGPFAERDVAEHVACLSAAKHPAARIMVEPVTVTDPALRRRLAPKLLLATEI